MNQLLQFQAALQVWVTENQDSPDVARVKKVIDHLAKLAETPFGTQFGKELLVRWVRGENLMNDILNDDQEWNDDDFDERDDEPPDSYDLDFDECGFIPGEGCPLVGSEDCELDCPYRDAYYKEQGQP